MSSFGTLYTYPNNPRSTAILAVAKANGLELDIVETTPSNGVSAEYLELNGLGKVPTFKGADGFVLHEAIAIAIYLTSQNSHTQLLGSTKQDYALILKYLSYFNSEICGAIGGWFRPLVGRDPYNKKNVDDSAKKAEAALAVIEKHLLTNTYLVGERITLADLFAAAIVSRGFQYVFDKPWRTAHPNITRWYETVYNQPIYSAVVDPLSYIDEAVKYVAPKKEAPPKKEAAPKAAPKPKAKEVEEEDEEPVEAPRAKHPLEALAKPTLPLDEFKRQYSNNETPDALAYFWSTFYKPEEYSIWKVDYKYNDELTQVFMTSNLIGGFFARLEGSRKYIFGCASVYGAANDSVIQGAFVIRGQDATPAFDVAPDFESYEFTKLDATKAEDREFVNEQWTWEKPVVVGGKTYPWADGKVFK